MLYNIASAYQDASSEFVGALAITISSRSFLISVILLSSTTSLELPLMRARSAHYRRPFIKLLQRKLGTVLDSSFLINLLSFLKS